MTMWHNIPAELREQRRWAAHQGVYFYTHKRQPAYLCRQETWCSFEEALAICQEYKLDGPAFAVMADDDYVVVTFTRIDESKPWPSYAERSKDGKIRVILKGQ